MKTGGRESQVEREKRGVSRVYLRADGSDGKESACRAGDPDSIPVSGRSPGEGHLLTVRPGATHLTGLASVSSAVKPG